MTYNRSGNNALKLIIKDTLREIESSEGKFQKKSSSNISSSKGYLDSAPDLISDADYETTKIRLSFLLLHYIFTQDDGEIDSKEQKIIRKIVKTNSKKLTMKDFNSLNNLTDVRITKQYVLDFLEQNNVKINLLNAAITTITNQFKKKTEYKILLRDLRQYI